MQKKKKKDVEKDEQMNIASFLIRNKPPTMHKKALNACRSQICLNLSGTSGYIWKNLDDVPQLL